MIVHLVINRNARHLGPRSALRARMVGLAAELGVRVHETSTLEALGDAARGIAASGAATVVLAGGDGAHMAGVTALERAFQGRPPPVALAPGGTVCTVARNLGLRGRPWVWAERVLRAAVDAGGSLASVPTLRLRDDAGGERVGFIFGAGLVAGFFDVYDAAPHQGLPAAAALAGRVVVGSLVGTRFARRVLAPVGCALEVDGEPRRARAWSLILASTVPDVGLGVRATYRGGESLEAFHAVASTLGARALVTQIPRVLTGRAMTGLDHVDALARSLRVTFDAAGAYVLDGDLLRARRVDVTVGPVLAVRMP